MAKPKLLVNRFSIGEIWKTESCEKHIPACESIFLPHYLPKTDLDLIALEKGNITDSQAVDMLKYTMEQYANYGFCTIEEKIKDNSNYFYKNTGFLGYDFRFTSSNV